jgi:hypothetical protein
MSLRDWWENRQIRKQAERELKKLAEKEQPFIGEGHVLPPDAVETQPMGEVTGSYKTVRAMMDELIAEKKHGKRLAERIQSTIGSVPSSKGK